MGASGIDSDQLELPTQLSQVDWVETGPVKSPPNLPLSTMQIDVRGCKCIDFAPECRSVQHLSTISALLARQFGSDFGQRSAIVVLHECSNTPKTSAINWEMFKCLGRSEIIGE